MKIFAACLSFCFAVAAVAQQTALVPRVTRFSGVVKDAAGTPQTGILGITFALTKSSRAEPPHGRRSKTYRWTTKGVTRGCWGPRSRMGCPWICSAAARRAGWA
jgi:hypothetical protein